MAEYVREIDFLELGFVSKGPVGLEQMLTSNKIDLIFLDIQMPDMNGIEFLKSVQHPPMVIITTAFSGFALDGFQLNVLDYLLKPITFDRFLKAATKARDYHRLLSASPVSTETDRLEKGDAYFFIKCGNKYEKVQFSDILYIEALQNYVAIHTVKGKYMTLLHLKKLEQNLEGMPFLRVHKSYIVSIDKIDSVDTSEIRIGTHHIPISRNYRDQVLGQVVNKNLWIK
jgi:DNA-binding LytR/AlgR family response regulator